MRLVVLKDIHGNLPAFEAALEDARRQGYDQMVLLGDVVNGLPDSAACWHLAKSLGFQSCAATMSAMWPTTVHLEAR